MRKDILSAVIICIVLGMMEIFFVHPHEAHFFWQKVPCFFMFLGIMGSIVFMFFAKFLGKVFLYRKTNYYKESE